MSDRLILENFFKILHRGKEKNKRFGIKINE